MKPDERKLLLDTAKKLERFLDVYYRIHMIDKDVFPNKVTFMQHVDFENTDFLADASYSLGTVAGVQFGLSASEKIGFLGATPIVRQGAIAAPTGGATIDSPARTAINSIRNVLTAFGFTA